MDVRNKLFGVIGLRRTGIVTTAELLRRGANVLATDTAPRDKLPAEIDDLERDGALLRVGDDAYAGLLDCDVIVPSPGVRLEIPILQQARAKGIPILAEIELAYRFCPAPLAAVTGTKGKTTTCTLLRRMLSESGIPCATGGNIGSTLIGQIRDTTPEHVVVAEVSSFQLEATDQFRPRWAAILNIAPDHLDQHPSMEAYRAAKLKLFANQTADDVALLPADDPSLRAVAESLPAHVLLFSERPSADVPLYIDEAGALVIQIPEFNGVLCHSSELRICGRHNAMNALVAAAMALQAGADVEAVRKVIREFPGVPHRLELIGTIDGVHYINDSMATTPFAAVRALYAFDTPVVLIAGGRAKVEDFAELGAGIADRCRALVTIGEAAGMLESAARGAGFTAVHPAGTLDDAVAQARALAQQGDYVVLAPACASFDMFADYADRGDQFRDAVRRQGGTD